MRFGLILGEALTGLRRNASMVISVILVTFVSLSFVGAAILMQSQISTMRSFWVDRAQVGIYMCSPLSLETTCAEGAATEEQLDAVWEQLEGPTLSPLITSIAFDSKEDTYEKTLEVSSEGLADLLTPEQMYEVFWVSLADPQDVEVIAEAFSGVSGIEEVRDQMQYLDPLFSALTIATYIAVGIAILMLIAAVLLIATTIRLSAYARRREIGIMRLVGASNRFIQTPFVLEGVFAAFLGSALASGAMLAGVHFGVNEYLRHRVSFIVTWITIDDALLVIPVLIGIGIILAALSASFAIRRWLRA